jgi:hypothetical protein
VLPTVLPCIQNHKTRDLTATALGARDQGYEPRIFTDESLAKSVSAERTVKSKKKR